MKGVMYKKLISSILIVAILNLVGCYSSEFITEPEFEKIKKDAPKNIRVITKDAEEYHFSQPNFYIVEDTLYGKEMLHLSAEEQPFEGKFALSEIKYIQFQKPDRTYSLVSGSEYLKIEEESGKPDEIKSTNLDGTRYHFMKDNYYIENDTLYGKGKLFFAEREELVTRKIALSDIELIDAESYDLANTCLLSIGILFGVSLLIVLFALIICAANDDCFSS
jgi:hypothetical protein